MRVNLNASARHGGYTIPKFIRELSNHYAKAFAKEYQIALSDAWNYLLGNNNNAEKLVAVMAADGIAITAYKIEGLPSWGFIIADDDPKLVEFKLIHGD